MRWPFNLPRLAQDFGTSAPARPVPTGLRKFDTFTPAEVRALPRELRRDVEADRLKLRTAALKSEVARGVVAPLGPRP